MDNHSKIIILSDMFYPKIEKEVIIYILENKGFWFTKSGYDINESVEFLLQIQKNKINHDENKNCEEILIQSPKKDYNLGMNPHLDSPVFKIDKLNNSNSIIYFLRRKHCLRVLSQSFLIQIIQI